MGLARVELILVFGVVALASCSPTQSAGPATVLATEAASAPPISVRCTPDPEAPTSLGAACPAVIPLVELAVAPVRLPIARVVIEPGPFFCDNVWPGAASEAPCYGPNVRPGQFMHAWVSFPETRRVAAVMLGRDLPSGSASPRPTASPWAATLVTVAVPPDGWTMP